jgi:hypothetical protein
VPVAPPPSAERLTTTSGVSAPGVIGQRAEWQPLARTEAAARSGMPLYGIDGLTPLMTSISLDRRSVLTLYRLDSGATLELEQERASTSGTQAPPAAQAARPALAAQRRAEIAAAAAQPAQLTWSGLRGEVRITLRTPAAAADLEALGAKLRVD